ncbi:MAG: 2-succinyl-5-enolpyruvyl-6-hydroxy-3-cyclohexene-1-carboxylic-acid synthase [Cyanobacteria bacterium P01_H01_bin.162]
MLDFRNTNTLWASVLVETLARLGLKTAVISPGSRSTPLTMAFASHPQLQAMPILDERSASFFALGVAKASDQPTVLVCTSGTAGANYFPALIEAYESEIPLIVLTADRPPELRDCASGQTIDQQKLFGRYVRRYLEVALPEATVEQLRYLRQVTAHAWHSCCWPVPGPVHLNLPFRDPLAPVPTGAAANLAGVIDDQFFDHLELLSAPALRAQQGSELEPIALSKLGQTERGLIIAGPAHPPDPQAYCRAIATLSKLLGWPVLADGLSPLRNHASLNPHLITSYDLLLRHDHHAQVLAAQQVLQLGALPTSKVLRQWLQQTDPLRWVMDTHDRNKDPLHGRAIAVSWSLSALVAALTASPLEPRRAISSYGKAWRARDASAQQRLAAQLAPLPELFEGKLSWQLPQLLPPETPLVIANSMPVRDIEWFLPPNDTGLRPYFSRGANGIDGTLSTAMGVAQNFGRAVLLTGDLAFLHDSNGLLNASQRDFHLTILLINNQGGGIFETLPIAAFEPPFETFFATPQTVNFAALAAAHNVEYARVSSWLLLQEQLATLPDQGIRLLELRCDRKFDAQFRTSLLTAIGNFEL